MAQLCWFQMDCNRTVTEFQPRLCSLQVSFTLNEELTVYGGAENKTVSAPREHPFTMQTVGGQTLAVFTETSSGECALAASCSGMRCWAFYDVSHLCSDSGAIPALCAVCVCRAHPSSHLPCLPFRAVTLPTILP